MARRPPLAATRRHGPGFFLADKTLQDRYRLKDEEGDVGVEILWQRRQDSIVAQQRLYALADEDRAKYSHIIDAVSTGWRTMPLEPGEEPMSAEAKERLREAVLVAEAA